MSATAILLLWFQKTASNEIHLNHLKHEAKEMGLTLLRKRQKLIRAVASSLVQDKVSIAAGVALDRVRQVDVSVTKQA